MQLKKVNLILGMVILILLLVFFAPSLRKAQVGLAYSAVTKLQPECTYQNRADELFPLNPDRCCRELMKQLECIPKDNLLSCSIALKDAYLINQDQYDYCSSIGYDTPIIIRP